ncbi:ABC-type sugar transport system substrate-binding protein [Streptacidiphilus sp. BW17]|uniref:ABC transporter substrate-binding protein n=1 Tax=Streptacidiphilus sp. BW17 TaxID=3156274 RepID=UPI003512335F
MNAVPRPTRAAIAAALTAGLCLIATACTNAGSSTASSGSGATVNNTANAQQTVAATGSAGPACTYQNYGGSGVPKLTIGKGTKIGFSQSESTTNPFRATETDSIVAEAGKLGVTLLQTNANADVNAQNSQIESLIAQGAQALIVAPENSDGLAPALAEAQSKKIPVLTIDRTAGTACSNVISFIGSDFSGQARAAADDLATATGSTAQIAVLTGTPGNNVATDRTSGFTDELKKYPDMKVVAQQTGQFAETTGQQVMAQLLQAHPGISAVYAENDEMALGAIQAIKAAGKVPGKDIKIVSIDGIQQAVQDVSDGTMAADIETNPRFGPLAFQSLQNFYSSIGVPANVIIKDQHFDNASLARTALASGNVY